MLLLALLLACDSGKVELDDTGTTDPTTDGGGTPTDGGSGDVDGDGFIEETGDCDDLDPTIYPGAEEIPWDDIDQDCDGEDAGTLASADGEGNLPIPDLGSIASTAEIAACATVYGTTVSVDISHGYVGDLVVSLEAPDGSFTALHVRSGGEAEELVGTYSSEWGASLEAATDLSILDGKTGTGTWALYIADQEEDDDGTLNSWSLELRCP